MDNCSGNFKTKKTFFHLETVGFHAYDCIAHPVKLNFAKCFLSSLMFLRSITALRCPLPGNFTLRNFSLSERSWIVVPFISKTSAVRLPTISVHPRSVAPLSSM